MEDVSHYFLLQLMADECKPLTEENYSKLSESGKTKFVVGDIPVSYFKMVGKIVNNLPEFELRMQFTSLTNALVEVADKKFIEMRNNVPTFAFEG